MKLYELADQYRQLKASIGTAEGDDVTEGYIATVEHELEAISDAFDVKAQNVALVVKEIEAEADMIDAEIKRLQARKEARLSSVDWLKRYLHSALIGTNTDKVQGPLVTVSLRKCPLSVDVVNEKAVPEQFVKVEVVKSISKKDLIAHHKATGEIIDGCVFVDDKKTLQIK